MQRSEQGTLYFLLADDDAPAPSNRMLFASIIVAVSLYEYQLVA
jgi:hypothetical protein